jgi:hypothetical protein
VGDTRARAMFTELRGCRTLGRMIMSTMNDLPGDQIDAFLGDAFGLAVRVTKL